MNKKWCILSRVGVGRRRRRRGAERSGEETEKLGARARGKRKEGRAVDTPTGEVKSNGRLKRVTG